MIKTDWNPQHYHQFSSERAQPALDLMGRIPGKTFNNIPDLGCGTGEYAARAYPKRPDRKTLFQFKRLFIMVEV